MSVLATPGVKRIHLRLPVGYTYYSMQPGVALGANGCPELYVFRDVTRHIFAARRECQDLTAGYVFLVVEKDPHGRRPSPAAAHDGYALGLSRTAGSPTILRCISFAWEFSHELLPRWLFTGPKRLAVGNRVERLVIQVEQGWVTCARIRHGRSNDLKLVLFSRIQSNTDFLCVKNFL